MEATFDARSVITRPKSSGRDPSIVVDTPSWLSRCPKLSTSASRGRLRSVSGSSVSSAHGSKVSAAFFAPEIGILPWSGLPPLMMILSIRIGSRGLRPPCNIHKFARAPCS